MSKPLEQLQANVKSVSAYEPFMLEALEVEGWTHVDTHQHDVSCWSNVLWEIFRHESGALAGVEWFSGLTEYQENYHHRQAFLVNAQQVQTTTYSKADSDV